MKGSINLTDEANNVTDVTIMDLKKKSIDTSCDKWGKVKSLKTPEIIVIEYKKYPGKEHPWPHLYETKRWSLGFIENIHELGE